MHIESLTIQPYQILMHHGSIRLGVYLQLIDNEGRKGWGEIAPLPNWSCESLEEAIGQLGEKTEQIIATYWTEDNFLEKLRDLNLYPSLSFGLESALLSILSFLPESSVSVSALLTGTPDEIFSQAEKREKEGFRSAKLKVSNLTFEDAFEVIMQLKNRFWLRIDVNRAWETQEALDFFDRFPLDSFDYVEEPFKNSQDLTKFKHPLAVDESFPEDLTFNQLTQLPALKAIIYKPTIQGGLMILEPLNEWAEEHDICLVLSSSFESHLGLANVASLAKRLSLKAPVGIGTYFHMQGYALDSPLNFCDGKVTIPHVAKE